MESPITYQDDRERPLPPASLAPVARSARIDVMDVLRGFALIGILMMNIEWFNRPIAELGGFDRNLTGLDHAAEWFVRLFVEAKFYKLFAMLFGMGFAVMLIRATEAGRPFAGMFSRRMAFLYLLGIVHLVFFWGGDILHNYAVGGMMLLGVVKLKEWQGSQRRAFRWFHFRWLRSDSAWLKTSLALPLLMFMILPTIALIGAGFINSNADLKAEHEKSEKTVAAAKAFREKPADERLKLAHEWEAQEKIKKEARKAKEAAKEAAQNTAKEAKATQDNAVAATDQNLAKAASTDTAELKGSEASSAAPAENVAAATHATDAKSDKAVLDDEEIDEDKLTPDQRIARESQQALERRMQAELDREKEVKAFSSRSYWDATAYRAEEAFTSYLPQSPVGDFLMFLPIFMFGFWLVKTEKLQKPQEHMVMFKSMAWIGLGIGLPLNAVALMIDLHPAVRYVDLIRRIGMILFQSSVFPMAIGILAAFVLMMQKERVAKRLKILAPLGQMALTNYLTHSVFLSTFFYGYGGNWFGHIGRAWQMVMVVGIIAVQLAFSHLWLKHFRYGPLEWVWRCVTYWRMQPLRIAKEQNAPLAISYT